MAENKINVDGQHQCLDIVEADGIENAGTYDADPFPGKIILHILMSRLGQVSLFRLTVL